MIIVAKGDNKPRLRMVATPWSRRLAKFKKEHPRLYKQIRFRWKDIGRNTTPKIDGMGIRVAYFPKEWYGRFFPHIKSKRRPVTTTIAFEKKKYSKPKMLVTLQEQYGFNRFRKTDEDTYNAYYY